MLLHFCTMLQKYIVIFDHNVYSRSPRITTYIMGSNSRLPKISHYNEFLQACVKMKRARSALSEEKLNSCRHYFTGTIHILLEHNFSHFRPGLDFLFLEKNELTSSLKVQSLWCLQIYQKNNDFFKDFCPSL